MKTIKLVFIFLFFYSSAFSQSYIDYSEVSGLIFKESTFITADFIKQTTKKNNKESSVKKLLDLKRKLSRFHSKYKGKTIYSKCKYFAEQNNYYYNLAKRTRKGYLEDRKGIDRANSQYMKNFYITRYNNGIKRYREDGRKTDEYLSKLNSCISDETYREKKVIKEYEKIKHNLYVLYTARDKNRVNEDEDESDIWGVKKDKNKKKTSPEIENFKENIRKKGCDNLFCGYDELHRIFLKLPEVNKEYKLYNLVKNNAGGLQSVELKWLLNYPSFEEEDNESKMNIFYNALIFSYAKETGDYEITDAFNSYANDKRIKHLGKYAAAFKKYLIEEGEGKGFESTNIDRTLEIKKYDNGNIKSKGYINKKNGRRIGKWVYFYKSGKKKQELNLDERERIIGVGIVYYEDGKIYRTAVHDKGTSNENQTYYYKNGVIKSKGKRDYYSQDKTGLWKTFDEKGELTSEGEYKNEIKIGKWTYYRDNGTKALIEEYNYISSAVRKGLISLSNDKKGITRKTFFYSNDKVHSVEDFKKNTLWRVISRFSSNGTEKVKDGTGVYEVYEENIQQQSLTSEVKNGTRHGITKWYYKNGQLRQSALYKYDKNSDFLGLRWEILSMFDKNGNQREKGSLKNGNGTWFGYDDNGFLIRQTKYKNGKKIDR